MSAMCAGYSLLYRRGLLKVDDFTPRTLTDASHSSFLVQLSKSPMALESTANVLLDVKAALHVISWFKGILSVMCPKVHGHSHVHVHTHGSAHMHTQDIHVYCISPNSEFLSSS